MSLGINKAVQRVNMLSFNLVEVIILQLLQGMILEPNTIN
jgi:hypothetical protein